MRNSKRTVHPVAVARVRPVTIPSSVAPIAHVVCSKAEEDSHRAAIHALPVNLGLSMSLTDVLARADLLQDAVLAE